MLDHVVNELSADLASTGCDLPSTWFLDQCRDLGRSPSSVVHSEVPQLSIQLGSGRWSHGGR